jgi:hypothetical protein
VFRRANNSDFDAVGGLRDGETAKENCVITLLSGSINAECRFRNSAGANFDLSSNTGAAGNTVHIVLTYNRSNALRAWINGGNGSATPPP